MHSSQEELLRFFSHKHLPEGKSLDTSRRCQMFAIEMLSLLEDTSHGAELTTGLRKLLEAKDAFVRASLP